jgi:hypothetical protein
MQQLHDEITRPFTYSVPVGIAILTGQRRSPSRSHAYAVQAPAVHFPLAVGKVGKYFTNNEHLAAGRVERVDAVGVTLCGATALSLNVGSDWNLVLFVTGALGISLLLGVQDMLLTQRTAALSFHQPRHDAIPVESMLTPR